MMETDDRSLKGLVADLGSNIATLFRKEIQLARAETAEKIGQAGTAVAAIAAGAILALAALLVLLQALVVAIAEAGVPPAVAALVVGVVVAIIAYALVYKGLRDLKANSLAPNRTVDSLKRDADVVKEQMP